MNIVNHRLENVDYIESPNQGGPFAPGALDSIIVHYTAGADSASAIQTLCDVDRQVSAHLVVDRNGTVTQLLPFNVIVKQLKAVFRRGSPGAIEKAGGRFLVRGGETFTLEGEEENRRIVVLEFNTTEQAQAFYDSEEYKNAKKERKGAAEAQFIVVDGV